MERPSGAAPYLPRALEGPVGSRLESFPVVVLTGARQTGKSTLALRLGQEDERRYLTLDDVEIRDQAERAPDQLLGRGDRLTLDEVQRAPDVLLAIKRDVDRDRRPGRFLLTGSANLLLMEKVSESLAGRAVYHTLRPLTRRELAGEGRTGRWSGFFDEEPERWPDWLLADEGPGSEPWRRLVRRGGYPVPAHHLEHQEDREHWFSGYVQTYLERDVQDLSAIQHLADYRRLMRAACLRIGNLLNQADLARDVGLAPSTAQRYVGLLETSYQLVLVEAFAVNRTKRLTKSPKIFWSDTALALHLAGEEEPRGAHLETLVLNDLQAWTEVAGRTSRVFYWRTAKGLEVDLVVERGRRVLPIEVKSGSRVRSGDLRALHVFLDEYPDLAPAAVVLYDGDEVYWIREKILAVPWWRVV